MKKSLIAISFLAMFVLVVAATVMSMPSIATEPMRVSAVSTHFNSSPRTFYSVINNNPSARVADWDDVYAAGNYLVVREKTRSIEGLDEIRKVAKNNAQTFIAKWSGNDLYKKMTNKGETPDLWNDPAAEEFLKDLMTVFPLEAFLKLDATQLRVYSVLNQQSFSIPLFRGEGLLDGARQVSVSPTGIAWVETKHGATPEASLNVVNYFDFNSKEQMVAGEFAQDFTILNVKAEYHAVGVRGYEGEESDRSVIVYRFDARTRELTQLDEPQSSKNGAVLMYAHTYQLQPSFGSHYVAWLALHTDKKNSILLQDVKTGKAKEITLPFSLVTEKGFTSTDLTGSIALYGETMYITHTNGANTDLWRYTMGTKKMEKLLSSPRTYLHISYLDDKYVALTDVLTGTFIYSLPKKSLIAEFPSTIKASALRSDGVTNEENTQTLALLEKYGFDSQYSYAGMVHGKLVMKFHQLKPDAGLTGTAMDPVKDPEDPLQAVDQMINEKSTESPDFELVTFDLPK